MSILELVQSRHSSRVPFDPKRPIPEDHLHQILEAARWAPTAHNMQNFEIVVVDDRETLKVLSQVRAHVSQAFIEENFHQLSHDEEELRRKKVGILGEMFPLSWRTHGVRPHADEAHAHSILGAPIADCAALLLVLYDPRRRAPASEGDVLGMMSLGCVMDSMWLMAEALGVGYQVQSTFGAEPVEREVRAILGFPEPLKTAFAVRLGYPTTTSRYLRVRRDLEDFTHRNRYQKRPAHR